MFHVDIKHYLEAICHPKRRFRTLEGIEPALDNRGNPVFVAGSNSVTFKIRKEKKWLAMKCYTGKIREDQERFYKTVMDYLATLPGDRLVRPSWLDREIYIFDHSGKGCYLPVLLSEWMEGVSLRRWLTLKCRDRDSEALSALAGHFVDMALWLLAAEWAHGDLKTDNILVTENGTLKLIDYDGVFVPAFTGEPAPELGTPGFQHPARDAAVYNRHLDDYSLALICTALYVLAEHPEWYLEQADDEKLLYDPVACVRGNCPLFNRTKAHWIDSGRTDLYRLAALLGNSSPILPELTAILGQIEPPNRSIFPEMKMEEPMEVYRENGCYGFITPAGVRVTAPVYDDAGPFREGLAAVRSGKRWFYIDLNGYKRIDATGFDRAEPFAEGFAGVCRNRKWGYVGKDGRVAIELQFDHCRTFREGLAAVQTKGKWGYIDTGGQWVVPPQFDSALDFREGTAVVEQNRKFGYIDPQGEWVIEPLYTFASAFRNGKATVEENGVCTTLSAIL